MSRLWIAVFILAGWQMFDFADRQIAARLNRDRCEATGLQPVAVSNYGEDRIFVPTVWMCLDPKTNAISNARWLSTGARP